MNEEKKTVFFSFLACLCELKINRMHALHTHKYYAVKSTTPDKQNMTVRGMNYASEGKRGIRGGTRYAWDWENSQ